MALKNETGNSMLTRSDSGVLPANVFSPVSQRLPNDPGKNKDSSNTCWERMTQVDSSLGGVEDTVETQTFLRYLLTTEPRQISMSFG